MKRNLPQIPSCKCVQQYYSAYFHATPTLFTQPVGKVPIKTVCFGSGQSLSNYSLLIFSSGWTQFILGVESCPKAPGIGHAFFSPPGGVKLYQELRVMQCWSGSLLREKTMKNRTKLQMRCWPLWFGARLDTITTLCWTHADCCNQTLSAI